jgi:hypothetical protein
MHLKWVKSVDFAGMADFPGSLWGRVKIVTYLGCLQIAPFGISNLQTIPSAPFFLEDE